MTKEHIVIFPFMAKGHTIPLIHLAAALSLSNHLRLTIVTTPANAPFLRRNLPLQAHPDVDIVLLPFPQCPLLPSGCESTDLLPSFDLHPLFVGATTLLREPFERLLRGLMRSSESPPLCLISDLFLWWTLDVCRDVGLPRIVFHGMSAFSLVICKSLFLHLPHLPIHTDNDVVVDPFHVPGTPDTLRLTRRDIPGNILAATDPLGPAAQFMAQVGESDNNSWGVIVNSFSDVDGGEEYVKILDSFYVKDDARAWLVGPLAHLSESLLKDRTNNIVTAALDKDGHDEECVEWLNKEKRAAGSVVYVSFGTQACLSSEQLDEVAFGLEESGYEYLWVVRSTETSWFPPQSKSSSMKGRIVKWAPQGEVLRHEATGGFVSHCGWNSVLDGVSAGVPFLTWPMVAEQHLNSKHLVEELGAGIKLESTSSGGGIVGREEVRDGVRELMGGERGRRARERAEELSNKAKLAVSEGGSSRRTLVELVEKLRRSQAGLRLQRNSSDSETEQREVDSESGRATVSVPVS